MQSYAYIENHIINHISHREILAQYNHTGFAMNDKEVRISQDKIKNCQICHLLLILIPHYIYKYIYILFFQNPDEEKLRFMY